MKSLPPLSPNLSYHAPVMLAECLEAMRLSAGGVFVDATFGGGGHSAAILAALPEGAQLYSFDQDNDAELNAKRPPFSTSSKFHFVRSNFRFLQRMLRSEGVRTGTVQGILADLGVSSYQIDTAERGFSYRFDAPLDMRMDTTDGPTAADLLNSYSAEELQRILSEYGEVRNARTLAQAIVQTRMGLPFSTTGELNLLCERLAMGDRMRYRSQVFQALRMEVNDEMGALGDFLDQCHGMLAPDGHLVVMTYHSIEDRIVKNFLKTGNVRGEVIKDFYGNIERPFENIYKKPLEANAAEVKQNPRARSAKLRAVKKRNQSA
jgi:16S rRNA (cytosine1402-N4)-methyltransferase